MRTKQPFDEHVAVVTDFIKRRSDRKAREGFYSYVITQSIFKMEHRFRARKHQRLYSDIVGFPARDLTWKNDVSEPNGFDRNFLTTLHDDIGFWVL